MARVKHPQRRALPPGVADSPAREPAAAALVPVTLLGPDDPAGLVSAAPDPSDYELRVAAAVLERWNSGKSPNTQRERLADLRQLGLFAWGCADASETLARLALQGYTNARAIVSRWHEDMIRRQLTDATRKRRIVSVRGAIGTAARAGALQWTIYDVDVPRVQMYGRTSGPPWRDVERALLLLRDRGDWRSLALVLLLYDVGVRSREASTLLVERVHFEASEIEIVRKGSTDVVRWRITARTRDALRRAIDLRPAKHRTSGPVFTHGFRAMKPWSHTAVRNVTIGLGLGHPHGLRHAMTSRVLELTNGDMRAAQGALGHKNVNTTQIYVDTRLHSMQAGAMETFDEHSGEGWIDGTSNGPPRETKAKRGSEARREDATKGAAQARARGTRNARREPISDDRGTKATRKQSRGARAKQGAKRHAAR